MQHLEHPTKSLPLGTTPTTKCCKRAQFVRLILDGTDSSHMRPGRVSDPEWLERVNFGQGSKTNARVAYA